MKRPDIAGLMERFSYKQTEANKAFSILRKMFNLAEVWGYRPDGTNPCRQVHPPYQRRGHGQTVPAARQDRGRGAGELRYPVGDPIRLQFEFAGRRGEIVSLEWEWIDLENRRVVWPDSKTGGMFKPISEEAYRLLSTAPRQEGNPYVLPSPRHPGQHLATGEYYDGWSVSLTP